LIPLIAPPFELTQPDPNKGKISKSVNMESLLPRPNVQTPRAGSFHDASGGEDGVRASESVCSPTGADPERPASRSATGRGS